MTGRPGSSARIRRRGECWRRCGGAAAAPVLVLSSLDEEGRFDRELLSWFLNDREAQESILGQVEEAVLAGGYRGVDVDFEYARREDREALGEFVGGAEGENAPPGQAGFRGPGAQDLRRPAGDPLRGDGLPASGGGGGPGAAHDLRVGVQPGTAHGGGPGEPGAAGGGSTP